MDNFATIDTHGLRTTGECARMAIDRPAEEDSAAFVRAMAEHRPMLVGMAHRLAHSHADAQDLVQDTFERALVNRHKFQAGSNLRAWLVTLMHHLFIDRCRKLARKKAPLSLNEIDVPAPSPSPEEPAWARVSAEHLQHALAQLAPEFREVYRLACIEGVPYAEVAQRLSLRQATVGTRINRARAKLKALLLPLVGEGESSC